ncbi:LemA family protein [Candidatus Gracilibacteria bacterium]|nr:LemA family protein [Candidatus Gracilibacteria bacterium]
MDPLFIVGILVGVFGLGFIVVYNIIISAKNSVEESASAIETVFQNRHDLIPNLVEVVKKYSEHEKSLLENITKLRSSAMSGQEITPEKLSNENQISGTLKSIFALGENYPDLKANENFINLQNEWSNIEDNMQAARRAYNAAVKLLNNKKQMFPSNIVAGMMTLKDYPLFEADKEAKNSLDAKNLFAK